MLAEHKCLEVNFFHRWCTFTQYLTADIQVLLAEAGTSTENAFGGNFNTQLDRLYGDDTSALAATQGGLAAVEVIVTVTGAKWSYDALKGTFVRAADYVAVKPSGGRGVASGGQVATHADDVVPPIKQETPLLTYDKPDVPLLTYEPKPLLPSGKPSTVVRNALDDKEFTQATDFSNFKGGQFVGAPDSNFPGIDGWLEGVPIQLKVVTGDSIHAIRRNIVEGAEDFLKATNPADRSGDLVLDATKTGVSMREMIDHFKPSTPVSNIVTEGTVKNIYIKTQDDWLNVTSGKISTPIE